MAPIAIKPLNNLALVEESEGNQLSIHEDAITSIIAFIFINA
jgi:hypothetical protein